MKLIRKKLMKELNMIYSLFECKNMKNFIFEKKSLRIITNKNC